MHHEPELRNVAMQRSGSARLQRYTTADSSMNEARSRTAAPCLLILGAVLGVAGTFVPSAALRGLLWGIDGIALVAAGALLTIYHLGRGNELLAGGFLVFVAGETLILATAASPIAASGAVFGAGVALWSASLILVSVPRVMPAWLRTVAFVAALLFAFVAIRLFLGQPLTALTQPLPFFAYPFLAATLFGWAWVHYRALV